MSQKTENKHEMILQKHKSISRQTGYRRYQIKTSTGHTSRPSETPEDDNLYSF